MKETIISGRIKNNNNNDDDDDDDNDKIQLAEVHTYG